MSDEKRDSPPESGVKAYDTEPAPPPSPSTPTAIAGVPIGIVKGGTSSGSYDRMLEASEWDANRRRAVADRQAAEARKGARKGVVARLGENSFLRGAPRAVFFYLNRDGTIRQECVSEITMVEGKDPGQLDLMFTLVCPRCLERGVPQGHAQCQIRSSHRRFHVREDSHTIKMGTERYQLGKGQIVKLKTPYGQPWPVIVCGSITCDDVIRCDNYNCNWAVRIDESRVYEV